MDFSGDHAFCIRNQLFDSINDVLAGEFGCFDDLFSVCHFHHPNLNVTSLPALSAIEEAMDW